MNSLTKVQDPFLNFNDMEHFFKTGMIIFIGMASDTSPLLM